MKRILIVSTLGVPTTVNNPKRIIPAAVTRKLRLAGGPPMEQAVPEDYYLASMTIRAMEQRDGRTLEFILKTYLPVALVPTTSPRKFCFVEQVGMTSETLRFIDRFDLDKANRLIDEVATSDDLVRCIDSIRAQLGCILDSDDVPIVGLLNGLLAPGVSKFIDRPSRETAEDYSVTLPSIVSSEDLEGGMKVIRDSIDAFNGIIGGLSNISKRIHVLVERTVSELEGEAGPTLSRLDRRIESLEKQIEQLESRRLIARAAVSSDEKKRKIELMKTLEARRAALKRDLEKRSRISEDLDRAARVLLTGSENLRSDIDQAEKILQRFERDVDSLSVSAAVESGDVSLLIPFIVVGFSRKGVFEMEVYPPSHLVSSNVKVGRRRNFVDNLTSASHSIDALSSLLKEQINSDVTMRKKIRDLSARNNLLSLKSSRKIILEGARFLVGDGVLKQEVLDELENLMTGIPESKLRKRLRHRTLAAGDKESVCRVRFHVHDESGKPVEGAEIELGALVLESDSRGMVEVSLPKSNYEGVARARGFFDKDFEFTIDSTDAIMIPLTLRSLSHEDRIAAKLDELVERARRHDLIRERLRKAFEEQGQTLLSIPAYRSALSELLTELGSEPESWIAQAKKQQGMVKSFLKRDDRRYGLRRDILHLAEESKQTGGITRLSEVLVRLDDLGWETDNDEVESILNEMAREGLIQGIKRIEGVPLLVEFVPVALTDDPQLVLALAAKQEGMVTIEDVVVELEWTEERVRNALDMLVETGVAKEQKSYSKSTRYWFPGLRGRDK
ncbi:MAG: hypothetical protein ACP6KW_03420 [Candidatus Thorarchaeota archaeon]